MTTRLQRLGHTPSLLSRAQRSFVTSRHVRREHQPVETASLVRRIDTTVRPSAVKRHDLDHLNSDRTIARNTRTTDSRSKRVLVDRRELLENYAKSERIKPEVHWALNGGYKVGTEIEKTEGVLSPDETFSFENDLIPGFDNDKVLLKIQTLPPATIIHLPNFWLRDNCRCSECVNQDTMQRAFDTFSIPETIRPLKVTTEKEGLQITWENDGHMSTYPWDWILRHRTHPRSPIKGAPPRAAKQFDSRPEYWDGSDPRTAPSVSYDEIMADDKGVGKWTSKILKYGFCYVDGCPVSPEKTEELLKRIAFIRPTHYGGFYDFTSDLTMKDTAYTSLALPAHTDNTYFSDPARLQMFHLLSHTEGEGGSSLLSDGFEAARILHEENEKAFNVLRNTPIQWHASGNEGITITPYKRFPVINRINLKTSEYQIRWNNDDRGVVNLALRKDVLTEQQDMSQQWYWAARKWDEILKRKSMQYWAQLEPGRPLIFDNWRMLHGRSAFTGKRRICGGYINGDDFISRWRNTNFTREEVFAQIL